MQSLALTASTAREKRTLMEIVDMQMNRLTDRNTDGNMSSNGTLYQKQV